MFTIGEIETVTGGKRLNGDPEEHIASVHFDSRQLEKDSLFVALTGGVRDGHQFIAAAQKKGASAALITKTEWDRSHSDPNHSEQRLETIDQFKNVSFILVKDTEQALQSLAQAYRQKLDVPIVAITGSNGKTTTKDMLAHLLSAKWKVYKTHKNLNNHLGLPLSLLQIKENHQAAVLELGMNHAGEIDFLAHIAQPTVSVITNIGDAHIQFFGSKEKIAQAKGELLPHTDPQGYVLLNKDDAHVSSLANHYSGKVYSFSTTQVADIYATDIQYNEQGTSFQLHMHGELVDCFMPMFGQYNVSNLLPGAFIAYQFGMSLEEIRDSLLGLTVSDMRFQMTIGPNESILINDAYNASPTSMKRAIDVFWHIYPARKKVVVLGDIFELGEQSDLLHAQVGSYLQDKGMTVITVGKQSAWIAKEAGGTHFASKKEAVDEVKQHLRSDTAILFKASRGMELEELINAIHE